MQTSDRRRGVGRAPLVPRWPGFGRWLSVSIVPLSMASLVLELAASPWGCMPTDRGTARRSFVGTPESYRPKMGSGVGPTACWGQAATFEGHLLRGGYRCTRADLHRSESPPRRTPSSCARRHRGRAFPPCASGRSLQQAASWPSGGGRHLLRPLGLARAHAGPAPRQMRAHEPGRRHPRA